MFSVFRVPTILLIAVQSLVANELSEEFSFGDYDHRSDWLITSLGNHATMRETRHSRTLR